ncbi:SDR family oxidoreductase [Mycetocola reblochoni]|uniref:Short-chain dehydrogenase/reductase SDR n=2 Tax=Mycetocola reblochoni TaxID=331618 RepID=A0A1R4ITV5_9MICO|nr:SDR family oxidoreductase [Mycetocola reblochoni]RLP71041.1 SDR family oxidoreductase [Mycetocola reblochoni]SJN23311.1 short-chain dehydrogenase/reductase SDR [Mycetocola reblochoni REB411]
MTATTPARRAVVTGASSGIGAATVRALVADGWDVVAAARRTDRLEALAAETGATPLTVDVTDQASVDAFAAAALAGGPVTAVVNNAGGAMGLEPVADADPADWEWMYRVNVLGPLRITQAFLPGLRSHGGELVFVTSTAAHGAYAGAAGYTGAKKAEQMIAHTLRIELAGEPVRVIEIAPGTVATEEFSLVRFRGDGDKAAAVYAGMDPLSADEVAGTIAWALAQPAHVNVDSLILRPLAQVSNQLTVRRDEGARG